MRERECNNITLLWKIIYLFQGILSDGQEIAVKTLLGRTREGLQQLHNEVLVLAELQHKNLVRLHGFCLHQSDTLLVYEYIKNGSLDNFLFGIFFFIHLFSRITRILWFRKCKLHCCFSWILGNFCVLCMNLIEKLVIDEYDENNLHIDIKYISKNKIQI